MAEWHDPVRAAAMRAYIEGPETLNEIAGRLGIHTSTIVRWAKRYRWPRRSQSGRRYVRRDSRERRAILRSEMIWRLYGVIASNLSLLERRMTNDDAASGGGDERDTRALGTLARTLEKVTELEAGTDHTATAAAPKSGSSAEPDGLSEKERLRLELADRILKLRERGKP